METPSWTIKFGKKIFDIQMLLLMKIKKPSQVFIQDLCRWRGCLLKGITGTLDYILSSYQREIDETCLKLAKLMVYFSSSTTGKGYL